MNAQTVAEALACGNRGCKCGKRQGEAWITHCPVPTHRDTNPSLSVTGSEEGKLLVHCFGGCSQGAVIDALREKSLWSEKLPEGVTLAMLSRAKGLPLDFLKGLGWRDSKWYDVPAVVMPYVDEGGRVLVSRYRIALNGPNHYRQPQRTRLALYGLNHLEEARGVGRIVLVEGETDTATLRLAGMPVLGIPGAQAWRAEYAALLEGLDVYLWREPDKGGDSLSANVVQSLATVRIIEAPAEAKDPNQLWLHAGRDAPAFRQRMEELMGAAKPATELREKALEEEAQECWRKASHVLQGAILQEVEKAIRARGYAGDTRPPLLAYTALASALLERPLNLAFVCMSAAGKNRAVDAALELTPPTAYHLEAAGSPRALIYDEEADYRHKTVVVEEADSIPDDGPAASAIRALAADNEMAYDVVERDSETGRHVTRHIRKPGPTGLITTSIRPLGVQMGTRVLAVTLSDTPEQTRAVMHSHADDVSGDRPGPDVGDLIAAQQWLRIEGEHRVVVSYAHALAELVSADLVRMRRDFRQLLAVIQAVALLHQCQRARDEHGRIIATLEDYGVARYLLLDVFTATATGGVTPAVRETVEAVRELYQGEPLTKRAIADKLGLSKNTAWYRIERALEMGYLVNEETRKGHPAKIVPGDPLPENRPALPELEALEGWAATNLPKSNRTVEPPSQGRAESYLESRFGAVQHTVQCPVEPSVEPSEQLCLNTEVAGQEAAVQRFNANQEDTSASLATQCPHRPPGEVEDRRAYRVGDDHSHVCTCCGGTVRPDLLVDGLCPVCRNGRPVKEGSGHLVRLALDMGATLVKDQSAAYS